MACFTSIDYVSHCIELHGPLECALSAYSLGTEEPTNEFRVLNSA